MISYEEAYMIASEHKPNIDSCTEYENGWVFSSKEDDNYVGGWGHTPVVVLRDGNRTTMASFVAKGDLTIIKKIDLE